MAKEILLYSDIYSWSAEDAIRQMNDVGTNDVVLRWNNNGGELRYGWAILLKAKEIKGKKLFKNDGECHSMSAFAFLYNDNNECIDTGCFGFHRASFGFNYENDPDLFIEDERNDLIAKNASLRAAMEAKLDIPKFERITKTTLDELFSLNGRKEVKLSAPEALECKLINRIIQLTPSLESEISAKKEAITAHYLPYKIAAKTETKNNISTMNTIEEIKAQKPELYKAIFAKGVKRGIEKEFERVDAISAFIETDSKGAIEAIKSRKPLTTAQQTEFLRKEFSKGKAAEIEAESPEAIALNKKNVEAKTEAQKELAAFTEGVMKNSTYLKLAAK